MFTQKKNTKAKIKKTGRKVSAKTDQGTEKSL